MKEVILFMIISHNKPTSEITQNGRTERCLMLSISEVMRKPLTFNFYFAAFCVRFFQSFCYLFKGRSGLSIVPMQNKIETPA